MSLNSPSPEAQPDSHSLSRRSILQALGAGAFSMLVGCKKSETDEAGSKDTTENRSPIRVGISRRGRPRLKLRVPRHRKDSTAPTATATTAEPATENAECVVKGNVNSKGKKLYHVADGCPDYEAVKINRKGEKCFDTEDEARAAGWKKAGNCQ